MPKFIGNVITGAHRIGNNAGVWLNGHREPNEDTWCLSSDVFVSLSYSQAVKLPPEQVLCSLDTTDKGSRGTYAKRWYRWFARRSDVLTCADATDNMVLSAFGAEQCRALKAIEDFARACDRACAV